MKTTFFEKPQLVFRSAIETIIQFDINEIASEDVKGNSITAWQGRSVVIRKYSPTYEEVVSALIADKYSMDAQISILYNRDGSETHEAEYAEYQSWRAYCKDVAKQVVSALGYPHLSYPYEHRPHL